MSFWSSLTLARCARPPVVAASAIGRLLGDLITTGALVGKEPLLCELKYGPRVDADERTTDTVDWDDSSIIGTVRNYPWDRSETFPSIASLADALAADNHSLYRAHVSLGPLHTDIVAALTREPSPKNEMGMSLSGASFHVGPVLVSGLAGANKTLVGWMGLSFSGPGYYFPWTFREARERAEAVKLVGRLATACRAAWPVPPGGAPAKFVAARRQLGNLWLYDDAELTEDWLWFASES